MAESSKDTDQSMEDILQSIKRIIADEGEPAPAMPGSDVLELTELLAEDAAPPVAVAAASAPAPAPTPEPTPAAAPRTAQDDIDALFASAPEPVAAFAEPEPEPEPEPAFVPEPVAAAPAPAPTPVVHAAPAPAPTPVAAAQPAADQLMSDSTLAASVAALSALTNRPERHHPLESPVFRSGSTVEDLVLEALKPMLKEWLDGNLPSLVRTLVEREIRRVTGH